MKASQSTALAAALMGAAGGALAIYLFDPDAGKSRRSRIAGAAGEALEGARQGLETLAGKAREHAQHAQDAAAGAVSNGARSAQSAVQDQIAETSAALAAHAQGLGERLMKHIHQRTDPWLHRGQRAAAALRGEEEPSLVLPLAATAASFCAVGVGLMWLMDPDRGRSRRAMLGQRAAHIINKTGRTFNSTGRHLRNKWTGYAAKTHRVLDRMTAE